jgi:hypothetical protein
MSRATSHVGASGLRLSGGRMRRVKPDHASAPDPCSCQGFPCPRTLLWPRPYPRVPGHNRGSGLCIQGSGVPSWRSGSGDTSWMYHPSFPMVSIDLPMWWGQALFTVWLRNDVRVPRLHTVVRGTHVSGYR